MNIPSYSNQDTSKSANNKNKIVIIAGVAIAAIVIIGVVIAAILLGSSNNSGTASCALGATGINPIACRRDHF